ncbi:[Ni/Fe] hydrogenase group 1 small subunit [Dehalogenimonas sp. WBC-2]|nr:[Ni/Fe] hydrogenase group 1 small subunit [Dehalogenimonas sp. WBC-2]
MATKLTRRHFVELCAGSTAALGLSLFKHPEFERLFADALSEVPVIWFQGSGCNGCSVSALNSFPVTIQDLLLSEVVSGQHVSLRFHNTVMAAQGDLAMSALYDTETGPFALVVEGGVPLKDGGFYCEVGEKDGHGIPMAETIERLGRKAIATIALGTCASSGGISASPPNPGEVVGIAEFYKQKGITTPVINVPGCPPHPDWFVGTLAQVLIGGAESVKVDKDLRPTAFYGKLIHDQCPRRGQFANGKFATNFGDPDCLYELGCKGPITHADCNDRLWNNKTRWCIEAGAPCIGCAELAFPAGLGPIHEPIDLTADQTLDKAAIGLASAAVLTTAVIAATRGKSGSSAH